MNELRKADFALALQTLIDAVRSDRKARKGDRVRPRVTLGSDLADEVVSREQSRVDAVVDHPLEGAYSLAIHALGEALFSAGGIPLMQDVLALATDADGGRGASLVEARWNGIGSEIGGYWWS